uniref:Trafficking protein particle complex subunit 9 n=1 Tax=Plectus sambesii TaxID=2011161 RepID=A0A914WF28_9BILA
MGVRELVKSIYWVVEGKRLDLSFEKLDTPPCPLVPEEEKYRIGVENKASKNYRRKCVGRLRKQVADYTLMTGLPSLALEAYLAAIELLKASNDLLWLAGAYEGWACAAMATKYGEARGDRRPSFPRVATMTGRQMTSSPTSPFFSGHIRHRSDGQQAMVAPSSNDSPNTRTTIQYLEIMDKFRLAIEHYERFSFAAFVEYECVVKASSVLKLEHHFFEMELFIREHVGKYLDDNFAIFDHVVKSQICLNSATIFKEVGFKRKEAFFSRLAVLFRLHIGVDDGRQRAENDYKLVYPVLYKALAGYGIPESAKDVLTGSRKGPALVQIRALHEVYVSALRANYAEAAVRHLCFLLQAYLDDLEPSFAQQLCNELVHLCEKRGLHLAYQHIPLPCGIILPPLPMSRFPLMFSFKVLPLSPHLAPVVVRPRDTSQDIFIYTPFQRQNKESVRWVVDCACGVAVNVRNSLPFELRITNLSLQTDGVAFESVPVRLDLPPASSEVVNIKLLGVPRASGKVSITGYTCEVMFVKNVCKLKDLPWFNESLTASFDVDVVPPLPVLELHTALQRAPVTEDEHYASAETTIYSGQSFDHSIRLINSSRELPISGIDLELVQPKVCGGPALLELMDTSTLKETLNPGETRELRFRIFGIDPMTNADDNVKEGGGGDGKRTIDHQPEKIPYTGRLLTTEFHFRYRSAVDSTTGHVYERTARLPLAVAIMPAVTVADWHVLPGDGPKTRYVVLDVTNSTDAEAELRYSNGRLISVQPREVCRVPLLCPCSEEVASTEFALAEERRSLVMQGQEIDRLRRTLELHVAEHLDIRWTIPSLKLEGLVPVGPLLSSVSLLKQLVLPALSIGVSVNDKPYQGQEEITLGIGELVSVRVELLNSLKDGHVFRGTLSLRCFQEMQNGRPALDRMEHLIMCGATKQPFEVAGSRMADDSSVDSRGSNDYVPTATLLRESPAVSYRFGVAFRFEGSYKVRPVLLNGRDDKIAAVNDESFVPTLSFNVVTKV